MAPRLLPAAPPAFPVVKFSMMVDIRTEVVVFNTVWKWIFTRWPFEFIPKLKREKLCYLLLIIVHQWSLFISDHFYSVIVVNQWSLLISDRCSSVIVVHQWSLLISDRCSSVIVVNQWSLLISDRCSSVMVGYWLKFIDQNSMIIETGRKEETWNWNVKYCVIY